MRSDPFTILPGVGLSRAEGVTASWWGSLLGPDRLCPPTGRAPHQWKREPCHVPLGKLCQPRSFLGGLSAVPWCPRFPLPAPLSLRVVVLDGIGACSRGTVCLLESGWAPAPRCGALSTLRVPALLALRQGQLRDPLSAHLLPGLALFRARFGFLGGFHSFSPFRTTLAASGARTNGSR